MKVALQPKVALVHDDLVQWGGAERVLVGLSEIFPDAPIYTSVFDKNNKELLKNFKRKKIVTSFMQKIPAWRKLYKALVPLYPIAFEQFDFSGFDLVISQSTRFAKSIITKPTTKHISYCHTPPRFLWDLTGPLFSYLRIFDQISSKRVDHFIAGSQNAKQRIKKIYKVDCPVIYPYVDLDRFSIVESFDGGYFLIISRLNKYKRIDLAIKVASRLRFPLKIIGKGPEQDKLEKLARELNAEVEFLGDIPDNIVTQVLAGAKALLICGKEDFGITSLEAQSLGKPVIAFGEGGVLETVTEKETGYFFGEQTSNSLERVLNCKNLILIDPEVCKENAQKFSKEKFIRSFREYVL